MLSDGHFVGNHTYEHKNPATTLDEEGMTAMIEDVELQAAAFKGVTGEDMPLSVRVRVRTVTGYCRSTTIWAIAPFSGLRIQRLAGRRAARSQ